MYKVFDAYATTKGVARDALRFVLDGERVNDFITPQRLEMEDGDQIDAVLGVQGD